MHPTTLCISAVVMQGRLFDLVQSINNIKLYRTGYRFYFYIVFVYLLENFFFLSGRKNDDAWSLNFRDLSEIT
jgi:hypothetical protein